VSSLAATGRHTGARLRDHLPEGWRLVREGTVCRGPVILHDSFDLRLHRAGWVALSGEEPLLDRGRPAVERLEGPGDSALPGRVPKLVSPRALLPTLTVTVESERLVLRGEGGERLAVVVLRRFRRPDRPPLSVLRVEAREGTSEELKPWLRRLRAEGFDRVKEPVERLLLWELESERSVLFARPMVRLEAQMPSAEAVVRFFSVLLRVVRLDLPGAAEDLDPEFLHGLRVAVRRTRSVLPLAAELLNPRALRRIRRGFREIQRRTNRARDLDVLLLDFGSFRELPGAGEAGLAMVEARLRRERRAEQHRVGRFLRCRRVAGVLDDWEGFLETGWPAAVMLPAGAQPVGGRYAGWLKRAFRRAEGRARRAAATRRETDLHRLRIAFKRLRYVLELGESLHDPGAFGRLRKELKTIQDSLGRLNDLAVQERTLRSLAAGAGTGLPAAGLAELLVERRRELSVGCLDLVSSFLDRVVRDPGGGPLRFGSREKGAGR